MPQDNPQEKERWYGRLTVNNVTKIEYKFSEKSSQPYVNPPEPETVWSFLGEVNATK